MPKTKKEVPLRPHIPNWIPRRSLCEICQSPILTMAFIGTGVCSGDCKKDRDG